MSEANTAAARVLIMQAGLPPADAFLLIRILDMQGLSLGACTLSVRRLAEDCGLHPKSAERSLLRLEAAGWLDVERTPGRRARRRVLMPSTAQTPLQAAGGTPRLTDGSQVGDPPHGGDLPPAVRRGLPDEDPTRRRGDPPPGGGGTPRQAAGSIREHEGEHEGEHDPPTPLRPSRPAASSSSSMVAPEDTLREHDRLAAASRVAMTRAVEAAGGEYQGDDRPEHLEVGLAAAAWAARRGEDLDVVLDRWAREWVSVARARSARSWARFAAAAASGRPWAKSKTSGAVHLRMDPSSIPEFGDEDIPVEEGQRVIGYG